MSQIKPIDISWLSERPSKLTEKPSGIEKSSFKSIFNETIDNVKTTEAELQKQQYLLSTGQLDDPHTVPIAAAKAQLSVDMLITLRNKTVEAYNELMRINL